MDSDFLHSLVAEGPAKIIPPEDDWYGRFVGAWDFEWVDHKDTPEERHVRGEWHCSWIIGGQAIQDVFICPSLAERRKMTYPDAAYGTTIRVYNSKRRVWDILYAQFDYPTHFEGTLAKNGDIVHTLLNCKEYSLVWRFSDIKRDSFHWSNNLSMDGGKTWILQGELFANRRA